MAAPKKLPEDLHHSRIHVVLTEDQRLQIFALAEERGLTVSKLVRKWIDTRAPSHPQTQAELTAKESLAEFIKAADRLEDILNSPL